MAITLIQKRKKQVYLFIALIIILLVITVVLGQGFLKVKRSIVFPSVIPESKILGYSKIEINFGILEKPELKEFIPFGEISPFGEEVGRENPFLSY